MRRSNLIIIGNIMAAILLFGTAGCRRQRKTEEGVSSESAQKMELTATSEYAVNVEEGALESEKIDFQWMINFRWAEEDMELLEAVRNFWELYSSHAGDEPIKDYESLPIYKCYYCFFTPIEYLHPNFDECDESIWPILFQMLYGVLMRAFTSYFNPVLSRRSQIGEVNSVNISTSYSS